MKAVRRMSNEPGHLACVDVAEPQVKPGYVKVKVHSAGLCGSDLHFYHGEVAQQTPITLGHEFSGTIAELGAGVTGLAVGERVTTETAYETCGVCPHCKEGRFGLCSRRLGMGQQVDGCMAEYVVMPAIRVHKIPDNVTMEEAALTEPASVAYHAVVDLCKVTPQDVAVVIGPGPIGLLCAQILKAWGACVVLVGKKRHEQRLQMALELGADHVIASDDDDVVQRVRALTKDDYGADFVFECSGKDESISEGINMLRKGGTLVEVGVTNPKGSTIDAFLTAVLSEITIQCSFSHRPHCWEKVLELMSVKALNVAPLITGHYKFDDCVEAFTTKEKIKILLHP